MQASPLSLFTGLGGIDLAAEWAGLRTVGQVEISDFRSAILEKHWPDVPKWKDIHDVSGDALRSAGIDQPTILAGGFPCQPFSVAGQRRGQADDRYLWPEMLRLVQESRPAWVVGENVAGFVGLALDEALTDLERAGYSCRAFVLPAEAVGARHERYRCFVVAHAEGQRRPPGRLSSRAIEAESLSGIRSPDVPDTNSGGQERARVPIRPGRSFQTAPDTCRHGEDVPDADRITGYEGRAPAVSIRDRREARHDAMCCSISDPLCSGRSQLISSPFTRGEGYPPWCADPHGDLWLSEPDVGRVVDGVPSRVDRVEALGLAVVPQQVFPLLRAIAAIEVV